MTKLGASKPDWEDADARKQRKREEGLARQQALQAAGADKKSATQDDSLSINDLGEIVD